MNGFPDFFTAIMEEVLDEPIVIDIDALVERTPEIVEKITEPQELLEHTTVYLEDKSKEL